MNTEEAICAVLTGMAANAIWRWLDGAFAGRTVNAALPPAKKKPK
ncbi:hypothetical protein LCGC14_1882670, partial [marine sediment metagenome]